MRDFIFTQYKLYLAGNKSIDVEKLDKLAKRYLNEEDAIAYQKLKEGNV